MAAAATSAVALRDVWSDHRDMAGGAAHRLPNPVRRAGHEQQGDRGAVYGE